MRLANLKLFFREKQKSSQRKIHKSRAKKFIEIPL